MFFGQAKAPWATAFAVLLSTACSPPMPRQAPFTLRPDSVERGTLLGPFSGQVVDEASGEPVSGALVYGAWTLTSGYGTAMPGRVIDVVGSTDKNGKYNLVEVGDLPDTGSLRLTDFHLLVYKRGYVAYRSDRRFADLRPRTDFAQMYNQVRLERWRSGMSHARHLRFIGGGPKVAPLTAWELALASEELDGSISVAAISEVEPSRDFRSAVVAAQLLTEAQIKKVTGYDGSFETGPLNDQPDTSVYSSQHFKAQGRPQTFDIAIRLWKLSPEESQQRYEELASSLPGANEVDDVADRALRAVEGDIVASAFVDNRRGAVVMMTCGKSQCTNAQQLTALTRMLYDAVKQLIPERKTP